MIKNFKIINILSKLYVKTCAPLTLRVRLYKRCDLMVTLHKWHGAAESGVLSPISVITSFYFQKVVFKRYAARLLSVMSRSFVTQTDCSQRALSVMSSQARICWSGLLCSPQESSWPGIEPHILLGLLHWQVHSSHWAQEGRLKEQDWLYAPGGVIGEWEAGQVSGQSGRGALGEPSWHHSIVGVSGGGWGMSFWG